MNETTVLVPMDLLKQGRSSTLADYGAFFEAKAKEAKAEAEAQMEYMGEQGKAFYRGLVMAYEHAAGMIFAQEKRPEVIDI